ncbi:MAG TPA: FGGY-family carbohydrate kinase [Anaeromyxobacter sp.]|nr:FGGY-family carbohydrate kinase [Anaeromyxobacter sp.]
MDLGTSAVKLALVSARGRIAAFESRPLEVRLLDDGGAEQDPEAWWAAIRDGTRALLAAGAVPAAGVRAVAIGAQWSGTVPVDAGGTPLHPAIIWMDARGAPLVRELTGGPVRLAGYGVDKLLAWLPPTGGVPQHGGKDALAHVLWLRRARPDLYAAAARFLEPADWLGARLTGVQATTPATITLHWLTDNRDLARVRYDPGLVARAGVDAAKLPPIVPAGSVLGPLLPERARALGLGDGVQVVAGSPDLQVAAVGAGTVAPGEAHVSLGTSSWLCCHVPRKKTDLLRNMAALPSAIPGRYLLVNEQESAGICLEWLRDLLGLGGPGARADGFAELDRLAAAAPPGAGGVRFAPWLNGERSPVDDHAVRGAFLHLGLGAGRAHLCRAVLEGVALNTRWLMEGVERFVGRPLGPVRAIGGGARSAVWCQLYADVLQRPILQVEDPVRANARGAALLAAAALGWIRIDDAPALVPVARRFEPDAALGPLYASAVRDLAHAFGEARRRARRLRG